MPVNPGVSVTSVLMCLVLVGRLSSSSRVRGGLPAHVRVSTTGAAPLTVIVSSSDPTAQIRVDGGREARAEVDAVTLQASEPGQT